jgi:putative transposase
MPLPRRRSIRLPGYDYSQVGAYFVTTCTRDRQCWLSSILDGAVVLAESGKLVSAVWESLPERFPGIEIDAFVVMPNHVHGIVVIQATDGTTGASGTTVKMIRSATRPIAAMDANHHPGREGVTAAMNRPPPEVTTGALNRPTPEVTTGAINRAPTEGDPPRINPNLHPIANPNPHSVTDPNHHLIANPNTRPAADPNTRTVGARFIAPAPGRAHPKRRFITLAPGRRLGEIIRAFKAASTRLIRQAGPSDFAWQRNYYEHVIRDEAELLRVRRYIEDNPATWQQDQLHPNNQSPW